MRFPLSGIGSRLIVSSLSFPCVMLSCPHYVRTINLPECLPMCLKCHGASAKKPIKYGKYNADTKFCICIKGPSFWVHLTLNQRVVGSIPTAPTIGCFLLRQPLEQAAISTSFCFLFLDGATIRTCRSEPAGKVFVLQ